ncbi:hypothetical protein P8C59_001420 [Phyllachora maydis]|uniref:Uncharacterized protein n=1 Tax=Phyllachora maydis TaxID=1825666 RepID=A0AAD9HZM7_9PEZI|nr:hypothetical protein P8C59_001420 [Phyllachora maydis]
MPSRPLPSLENNTFRPIFNITAATPFRHPRIHLKIQALGAFWLGAISYRNLQIGCELGAHALAKWSAQGLDASSAFPIDRRGSSG